MPKTKDFLLVRAAVPVALLSAQDPSQETPSAEEAAGVLIRLTIVFLHFLR